MPSPPILIVLVLTMEVKIREHFNVLVHIEILDLL